MSTTTNFQTKSTAANVRAVEDRMRDHGPTSHCMWLRQAVRNEWGGIDARLVSNLTFRLVPQCGDEEGAVEVFTLNRNGVVLDSAVLPRNAGVAADVAAVILEAAAMMDARRHPFGG